MDGERALLNAAQRLQESFQLPSETVGILRHLVVNTTYVIFKEKIKVDDSYSDYK